MCVGLFTVSVSCRTGFENVADFFLRLNAGIARFADALISCAHFRRGGV